MSDYAIEIVEEDNIQVVVSEDQPLSLTIVDDQTLVIEVSTGPQGAEGDQGDIGPQGPQGDPGVATAVAPLAIVSSQISYPRVYAVSQIAADHTVGANENYIRVTSPCNITLTPSEVGRDLTIKNKIAGGGIIIIICDAGDTNGIEDSTTAVLNFYNESISLKGITQGWDVC